MRNPRPHQSARSPCPCWSAYAVELLDHVLVGMGEATSSFAHERPLGAR